MSDTAYEPTASERCEIKTLPPARILTATAPGDYFEQQAIMFRKLYRYIRDHDITMTVPVEADVLRSIMRFYVSPNQARLDLSPSIEVGVEQLPERLVASLGVTGAYSEGNFKAARQNLQRWLAEHPEILAAGPAYGVYWSSPWVPWFLKRFEVHIPVTSRMA